MADIREGMTVITSDGEKLGKVVRREGDTLVVGKGFFFPRDYLCRASDIRDVRGDEIHLSIDRQHIESGFTEEDRESARIAGLPTGREGGAENIAAENYAEERSGMRSGGTSGMSTRSSESELGTSARTNVSVPLAEEQLEVKKRSRKAGEVRVTKQVHTEEKHVTVPVTREEVHIERVPASDSTPGQARFENDTVRVPVMEEEVEVTKRPVVREEVRISKSARTEQRDVGATVRKEEAEIEEDPDGLTRGTGFPNDPHVNH